MRALPLLAASLLALPLVAADASPACPPQPVHAYASTSSANADLGVSSPGFGVVWVQDSNAADCDGDGVPGDWDGDMDLGMGGAAFGWGEWANAPACGFAYNVHGPNVRVTDVVLERVGFVVGEDDQDGPTMSTDPATGETSCTTDGTISPETDPDDCLAFHVGEGRTCGKGGGDGLYWVFLGSGVDAWGLTAWGPTAGSIVASPDP